MGGSPQDSKGGITTRIFISGPITGHEDTAKGRFDTAAREIRKTGHEPINPYYIGWTFEGGTHTEYMSVCIPLLELADAILMLEGWEESRGARAEYHHARAYHMQVYGSTAEIPHK